MRDQGLGSWPERLTRIRPDAVAFRFEGSSTTYREWASRVRRTAHLLARGGITRGDRVAYLSLNHPSSLDVMFACGQLGAIFVPINARLSIEEIGYILDDSGSATLVHGREHAEQAAQLVVGRSGIADVVAVESSDGTPTVLQRAIAGEFGPEFDEHIDTDIDPHDVCLLMYTSGTTGVPKGVMLSHDNMLFNAINQVLSLDITSRDVVLSVAPLFHIGCLGGAVTPVLLHGGTVVVVREFDAGDTLALIASEGVTMFFAVPTILDRVWRHPDFAATDMTTLTRMSVAGAPVPEVLIEPWVERGVAIQQAYGMTETAPSGTMLGADDVRRKIGSAGTMTFFTDVAVVAADDRPAAPGEVGEVVLSGRNVMLGYWRRPDATADAVRDGWMHTGDAGEMDDEGFLYIRDRYKDMYISGGENVYPAEVEAALLRRPNVVGAAVIGIPDEKWGETGVAFVVSGDRTEIDSDALRRELRSSLAAFKIPSRILTVDELPTTGSGKIRKSALRDMHGAQHRQESPTS